MVKIQVLGEGMIPGIGTVAPHKSPFEADYKLITRIMGHGSLKVRIQNPITKAFIPLTASNAKRMYETWNDYKAPKTTSAPVLHPTTPQQTTQPVIAETKVEENKVEEVKVEENTNKGNNNYNNQKNNNKHNNSFKPVTNPENK